MGAQDQPPSRDPLGRRSHDERRRRRRWLELRELDATKMYWFHKSGSHFVHSSAHSLASRLEWGEGRVTVRMESPLWSTIQVGGLAVESLLTALIAGALLLDWGDGPVGELAALRAQARPVLAELVRRVSIDRLDRETG